jgi:excisionase family DNA binding protein
MLLETALTDSGIVPAARYTLEEVATILGCDLDHVRYLVTRRKLPALKVGAQTWGTVRHEDLDTFLSSVNREVAHV